MKTIAIVGASGYIGRYLVAELARLQRFRVKILLRTTSIDANSKIIFADAQIVQGDLFDLKALTELCESASTVINLAYIRGAEETANVEAVQNLVDACKVSKVRRLIHLSTAMVTGRTVETRITEEQESHPVTEYATTKLAIERVVTRAVDNELDTVILRPTAVFGSNSENLKKLADDLVAGKEVRNYLKSCLFSKRRMNLVHVLNVVAAIIFLEAENRKFSGQEFIVSDTDVDLNNFRDVERILMRELHVRPYWLPRIYMPSFILKLILIALGKDNVNPRSDYVSEKLLNSGFKKAIEFEDGLVAYAASYSYPRVIGEKVDAGT